LAIAGVLIIAISLVFTYYLTSRLAVEESKKVGQWVEAQQILNKSLEMAESADPNALDGAQDCDYTFHLKILQENTTIPIILENERGGIDAAVNFGPDRDTSTAFLLRELARMKVSGATPLEGVEGVRIYYQKSYLLRLLEIFPIVQLILIAVFVLVGYYAFSSARRAEQNRVWVGMAKETAHQLGTPISAILGWIDHLRELKSDDAETLEVTDELRNDVSRLELIADRFSKIGSAPELVSTDIYSELEKSRQYMERRAPRKVKFVFPASGSQPLPVRINSHLFHWVIENLLRNALDAMDGQGTIEVQVHDLGSAVEIDVSDTGKGIPGSKLKTVFQPGYTTKSRGWGLGLSLAKRIVEEYHRGKIFVRKSEPGKGTTFSIHLPKGG
jgi:signal transduction histidine kinase